MNKAKILWLFLHVTCSAGAMTPTPPLINRHSNSNDPLLAQKNRLFNGMHKNPFLKKSALCCALGATYYGANYLYYRSEGTAKITEQCAGINNLLGTIDSVKRLHEDSSPLIIFLLSD